MTTTTLLQHVKITTLGKTPMVVLPMALWSNIEDRLEDLEILHSKRLKGDIAQSRKQIRAGKTIALHAL